MITKEFLAGFMVGGLLLLSISAPLAFSRMHTIREEAFAEGVTKGEATGKGQLLPPEKLKPYKLKLVAYDSEKSTYHAFWLDGKKAAPEEEWLVSGKEALKVKR